MANFIDSTKLPADPSNWRTPIRVTRYPYFDHGCGRRMTKTFRTAAEAVEFICAQARTPVANKTANLGLGEPVTEWRYCYPMTFVSHRGGVNYAVTGLTIDLNEIRDQLHALALAHTA